jgi:hypothetical protein
MSSKRLSLNLVLQKKGSLHAFQSAQRSPLECKEERREKASEKASCVTLEMAETPVSTESYYLPPDAPEKVQLSGAVSPSREHQNQQNANTPGNRSFLLRPIGEEDNPDPWAAWAPFLGWLREYHPDQFHAVCRAEEALRQLEQRGITEGPTYERACTELARRFEEARHLKFKETVTVWVQ